MGELLHEHHELTMIVYGYEDVMNYEAITKWDDFSSRNNAV